MYKAGYKTSEFWFTLVSFIFSGLYLVGLINDNGQKEDLIRDVSHGVESIILIGGQLVILWKYIKSRTDVKEALLKNNNNHTVNPPHKEGTDNDKSRTNKKRSRSVNSNSKSKPSRSKKNSNS
jgi:hypothetical protein